MKIKTQRRNINTLVEKKPYKMPVLKEIGNVNNSTKGSAPGGNTDSGGTYDPGS